MPHFLQSCQKIPETLPPLHVQICLQMQLPGLPLPKVKHGLGRAGTVTCIYGGNSDFRNSDLLVERFAWVFVALPSTCPAQ